MPSVTRQRRAARDERREHVRRKLQAAVEGLLSEDVTYTELSVERLVEAAGVSRSTFYVYFQDKGELLEAITEDIMVEMLEAARAWWRLPPDATKDDLRESLRGVFTTFKRHQGLFGAVVEVASYDETVRAASGGMMAKMIDELGDYIRAGQQQGFVRKGLDPALTAGWMTWMAERGQHQMLAQADEPESERLLAALTDIVWNTLYDGLR